MGQAIAVRTDYTAGGDRKVQRFGWTFAPGDKVMQIENDYEKDVYNGDIGHIDDVEPDAGEIAAESSLHRRHQRQARGASRLGRGGDHRSICAFIVPNV